MALDNQEHAMAVTIEDSGLMDLKKKVTEVTEQVAALTTKHHKDIQ